MPRSSWLMVGLPLLAWGCGNSKSEPVSVDLGSLLTAPPADVSRVSAPPRQMPGSTTTIPGLSAVSLRAQGDRELAEMRKLIDGDRERALSALTRRLARLYAEQAKRREDEIMGPLKDLIETASNRAYSQVTQALQEFAAQRAPLLPRFYLLVDRTDYQRPVTKPRVESTLANQRFEEANQIRSLLLEMDRDFQTRVQGLLAQAQRDIQAEETRLRAQFAEILLSAQDRAAVDAKTRLSTRRKDLDASAVSDVRIHLPATGAKTVTTPPSAPLPALPDVKRVGLGLSIAEQRATLETDLKIWMATSGYHLDPKGRNATQEFKLWRMQRKAGP